MTFSKELRRAWNGMVAAGSG